MIRGLLADQSLGMLEGPGEALLWMGAVVLAILLGVVIIAYVRKSFRADDAHCRSCFSLEELRRLLDDGTVTPEEFEVLKKEMIRDLGGDFAGLGQAMPDNLLQREPRP